WKLDEEVAYLSSDVAHETPFAARYRILDVFPFSLKRLRTFVRDNGVGRLDIKKRRFPMTPEQLRPKLKLEGDAHSSIVLTRIDDRPTVLVCEAK
ncbi:MAG TPA: SAM-dependent methyltransferase, partial [Candidatus Latescibacteria bacterium]|nr:SAM-dependent methyltransferase [Candidatus Latescibacterota bacterium]